MSWAAMARAKGSWKNFTALSWANSDNLGMHWCFPFGPVGKNSSNVGRMKSFHGCTLSCSERLMVFSCDSPASSAIMATYLSVLSSLANQTVEKDPKPSGCTMLYRSHRWSPIVMGWNPPRTIMLELFNTSSQYMWYNISAGWLLPEYSISTYRSEVKKKMQGAVKTILRACELKSWSH